MPPIGLVIPSGFGGVVKPSSSSGINPKFAPGLIGAWKFDDGAGLIVRDYSGNAFNGTIGAAPSRVSTNFGPGLQMTTASTSKVTIPYNGRFNLPRGFTISVRVQTPSSFSNTFRSIFGKPFASTHTTPFFDWSVGMPFTDSTHVQVEFRVGTQVVDTGATTYGVSTWVHIIARQKLNGDMTVSVNGVLDVATASGVSLASNTNSRDPTFGINAGNSENFEGIIEHAILLEYPLSDQDTRDVFRQPYLPLSADQSMWRDTAPFSSATFSQVLATINGAATVTPLQTGTGALTATINGQAALTDVLTGLGALATSIAGSATVTPLLTGTGALLDTINGAATVTAGPIAAAIFDVAINGAATVTPALTGIAAILASIAGAATVSPLLTGTGDVSTNIAGSATMTEADTELGALAASIGGVGTLTANVAAIAAVVTSITGVATVTDTLTGTAALASTVTGVATVSPLLSGVAALQAAIAGSALVTPNVAAIAALAVSVLGSSSVAPLLTGTGALVVGVNGQGSATPGLGGTGDLSTGIVGVASLAALPSGLAALAAAVNGSATVTVNAAAIAALVTTILGNATVVEVLSGLGALGTNIAGAGSAQVGLGGTGAVALTINGVATVVVDVGTNNFAQVAVTINAQGVVTATLTGKAALSTAIGGHATLSVGNFYIPRGRAVGSHVVRVVFNQEPIHKSGAGRFDALNPANYVVEALVGIAGPITVVGVSRDMILPPTSGLGDASERGFDIHVDRPLVDAVVYRVTVNNVHAHNGSLLGAPTTASFRGLALVADVDPTRRPALFDWGSSTTRGVWTVDDSGDIAPTDQKSSLRTRIIRRLITARNGFRFLSGYGVGLRTKDPVSASSLKAIKAEVIRQLKLEPEVAAVSVTITLDTLGVLALAIQIRTFIGTTMSVGVTSMPSGVIVIT